jgi:hypothetical protein
MMNSLHAWGKQINHAFSGGGRSSKHNGHNNHGGGGGITHNGTGTTKLSHSASSDSGCSEIHTSSSEQDCQKLGALGGHHHHHHHHHAHHMHHPHHHRPTTPQTAHRGVSIAANNNPNTNPNSHLTTPTGPAPAPPPPSALPLASPLLQAPAPVAPTPPTDAPFYLPPWQAMISVSTFVEFVKNRDIGRIKYAIREADFNLDTHDEVSGAFFLFSSFLGFIHSIQQIA